MDYREATDRLTACVTLEEFAARLGASLPAVKQARMGTGTGRRSPPPNWRAVVAGLARERAAQLIALANELGR